MAIRYLDGGRITGLSTDAKPDRDTSDTTSPALTIQAGTVFIETDTGARYVHNGTAWIQQSFDSLNSAFGKSGGVTQRQHFIDWCSGKQRNSDYWGYRVQNNAGNTAAGTITYPSIINGGMQIQGGDDANDVHLIAFCGSAGGSGNQSPMEQRPFDPYGCTCIFVSRHNNGYNFNSTCEGFNMNAASDISGTGSCAFMSYTFWTASEKYRFRQGDGSTSSGNTLSSSKKHDVNAHAFKIECLPKKVNYSIDGTLEATGTSYAPTEKMGLNFGCSTNTSGGGLPTINLTFVEAFNH